MGGCRDLCGFLTLPSHCYRSQVDFTKEGCGSDNVCKSRLQVTYRYGHWSAREETFTPLKL